MRSPHLGLGRGRDGTYYEMLVDRLEFNNNQYVQGVLNRDWDVCNVIHCICMHVLRTHRRSTISRFSNRY